MDSKNVIYKKSFIAKLVLNNENNQQYYSTLKNSLICYKFVTSKITWKEETFKLHGKTIAKIIIKGKTPCLLLALNPNDYKGSKYKVSEVLDEKHIETPLLYKIENETRCIYATFLILALAHNLNLAKCESYQETNYFLKYKSLTKIDLSEQKLIKRSGFKVNNTLVSVKNIQE